MCDSLGTDNVLLEVLKEQCIYLRVDIEKHIK
jgi:hypothetical protein